jgi:hypothetical protein
MAVEDADILLIEITEGNSGFFFAGKGRDHPGTEPSLAGKIKLHQDAHVWLMLCPRTRIKGLLDSSSQRRHGGHASLLQSRYFSACVPSHTCPGLMCVLQSSILLYSS